MCENSITKMEIEEINKEIKEIFKTCIQYSNRNVTQPKDRNILNVNFVEVDFYTEIPKEILIPLNRIIQSFVQICETHAEFKLDTKERGFLSGIKCINNLTKHLKRMFKITDIICPELKCETSNIDVLEGKTLHLSFNEVSFRLGAVWQPLKDQEFIKSHKTQMKNYQKYLLGEDVVDTVNNIKTIINKYSYTT